MSDKPVPVWVYVIFRRNPSSGHDKINVNESGDGPVFWNRRVIYVFCCSCHFDKHEPKLRQILENSAPRVERVCLVDRPVDYPFIPDSFFTFMCTKLSNLQFVYLRELDLEKVNRATVAILSKHKNLKKLIVHGCRNYDVFQDFHGLPQLLVVKGEILGLKAMIGDVDIDSKSGSLDQSSSSYSGSQLSSDEHQKLRSSPGPIAVNSD
ncbi:unnamed protein product [Bursaphelenchus xylophilus]|uniref:(pine wood nematode) hypothetical protein n=1 Tax=Bursaphelenchus xylophilus TaxID=6326 RepID=A0A1I7SML9_BURXY|nr:unnamed protein product [Bursaphelenchus xylophilus]CAG9130279.1 unnamed protein product [Bursaphelenchus xylophilus]